MVGREVLLLLFLTFLGCLRFTAGSSLKHMAAHGHDLKHDHSSSDGGAPDDPVSFNEAFSELKKYYEKERHSKVPQKVVVNLPNGKEFKLGKWVQRQRQV